MITAYYIFSAVLQSAAGSPPSGYGEARFEYRSNGDIYLDGSGFYINVEDVGKTAKSPEPFFCPYVLRRIDDKFKKSINAENEELNNEESERNFIIKAHAYFVGQENTPTQLQGPNAH
jgi:hypothetical protein